MINKILRRLFSSSSGNSLRRNFTNELGYPVTVYYSASLNDRIAFGGYNFIGQYAVIAASLKIGLASTVGSYNWMEGEVEVGNYSQLGPKINIISSNHPMNTITTYNSNFLFDGALKKLTKKGKVVIGNNCWVGAGVSIIGNVTIGDGVVIGAGSLINKDVPENSVVVGNPQRIVKRRISESVYSELKKCRWWNYTPDQLKDFEKYFLMNINDIQNEKALAEFVAGVSV